MVNKTKLGALVAMTVAGVIGLLWAPLFIGLPGQEENIIPRDASKWHMGKGSEYDPNLRYEIKTDEIIFSNIEFKTNTDEPYMLIEIDLPTGTNVVHQIPINSAYAFTISDDSKKYFDILDKTIFSIRDIALDEKYLVKKAVWDTVFIGATTQEITVTEHKKTEFKFGSADAYVISYSIGNKENKIWIVDNLPLPVKAEIYDLEGNLQYSYELVSLNAPLTPGLS